MWLFNSNLCKNSLPQTSHTLKSPWCFFMCLSSVYWLMYLFSQKSHVYLKYGWSAAMCLYMVATLVRFCDRHSEDTNTMQLIFHVLQFWPLTSGFCIVGDCVERTHRFFSFFLYLCIPSWEFLVCLPSHLSGGGDFVRLSGLSASSCRLSALSSSSREGNGGMGGSGIDTLVVTGVVLCIISLNSKSPMKANTISVMNAITCHACPHKFLEKHIHAGNDQDA